jgi:hypothetical protein
VLLNIFKAGAMVQVASTSNPAYVNQPIDFTATITSQVPVLDGSEVDFFKGTTFIGSATTSSGAATLTGISFPSSGARTITANFSGDIYHNAGSGTLSQAVRRYPTTTVVESNLNPSNVGQTVTFTATVTSSGPVPTGSVQFFQNGSLVATVALSGGTTDFFENIQPIGNEDNYGKLPRGFSVRPEFFGTDHADR